MITFKRENFRKSLRQCSLQNKFLQTRNLVLASSDEIEKYQKLLDNNNLDQIEFENALKLLQTTLNEELVSLILRYLERYQNYDTQLSEILLNKLTQCFDLQIQYYLLVSITKLILSQNNQIYTYFSQQHLMLIVQTILNECQELCVIPYIFDAINQWPCQFIKINDINDQKQLLLAIQKRKKLDLNYFYKIVIKFTDDINENKEFLDFLIQKQFISESIIDFPQNVASIIDFFINLSFLDNDTIDLVINYDFLSAIIFELNKQNNIQKSLYILIRNLLLSNYSIRLILYEFSIFSHLSFGIHFSLESLDIDTLEEILTSLQVLLQEDEKYQRKEILNSEVELQLQEIFFIIENNESILNLATEVLYLYYEHFQSNKNQKFRQKLQQLSLVECECYEFVLKYLEQN